MNNHNIDFGAMVSEMKPWPRSEKVFKALLGLGFQEIKNVEDIKNIYNKCCEGVHPSGPKSVASLNKDLAYFRWMDLSQAAIEAATNLPEAQKAWEDAPAGSYVKENGLIKMLEFSNFKQTKGIYCGASYGSLAKRKAVEKLATFFKRT